MKINETQRLTGIQSYRKTGEAHVAKQVRKSQKDELQISSEAKELLSSVRNEKRIEELKQAVASGTYHVDAWKLAEKLLPFLK